MSNPEADRNPDLIKGLIIGSKSLFAYSERAFFKGSNPLYPEHRFFFEKKLFSHVVNVASA